MTHLTKLVNKDADNWDSFLDPIIFAYRVNVQSSTKMTPFELMYGVRARLPVDLLNASAYIGVCDGTVDEAAQMERMTFFKEKVCGVRDKARSNISEAQEKQKRQYDIKHKGPEYKVGDKVIKYNRRRDTRMGNKLDKRYTGPYEVHEVLGKGVYRLRDGDKILSQVANANNLKLWNEQGVSSTSSSEIPMETTSEKDKQGEIKKNATGESEENELWVPDLNLFQIDREEIRSGAWLSDRVIDAVNKLVNNFMGTGERQSSLLAQFPLGFDRVTTECVQILHDRDHWVLTGRLNGKVMYMDSLSRKVSPNLTRQLCQLYASSDSPTALYHAVSSQIPMIVVCMLPHSPLRLLQMNATI